MAKKKKQVNESARIAEAVDWIKAALNNDSIAGSNDLLSEPLGKLKDELMEQLLANARESGKSKTSKGKGGNKERSSTQELPADAGADLIETKTRI